MFGFGRKAHTEIHGLKLDKLDVEAANAGLTTSLATANQRLANMPLLLAQVTHNLAGVFDGVERIEIGDYVHLGFRSTDSLTVMYLNPATGSLVVSDSNAESGVETITVTFNPQGLLGVSEIQAIHDLRGRVLANRHLNIGEIVPVFLTAVPTKAGILSQGMDATNATA